MPDEESVLDAVNAALETETHVEPADEPVVDDAGAESAPDSGDQEAAEGAEAGEEGAAEAGEGAEAKKPAADETSERNPDGTFKKREVKADGQKPDPAKSAEAKKPADALNDPIPKELKAETRERMKTLITTAKEAQAQATQATENFNVFVNGLQAAGVTPDQYGETLSYLSLFNKALQGDQKAGDAALEIMQEHVEKLATFLGKDFAVADPLSRHADLKEAVQKGQISQQYARELARTRNSQGFRGEIASNANRMTQQQQEFQQAQTAARTELNTLEAQLKASDPQYEAKKALIVPILKPIMAQLPPQQWKQAFQQAYAQAKVAAPVARPAVPKNQPMRGNKMPSGGSTPAAGSALDAMNEALSGLRR